MNELPTVLLALPSRKDVESLRSLVAEAATVVAEATTLKDARRALVRFRPKVAVMALQMPDGEALGLLADAGLRPHTRFVLMSPDPTPEDFRRAMRAGASDLLPVPVSGGEIIDAVRRMTDGGIRDQKGEIITVFSTKGGVGKTTIAANLAAELVGRTRTRVALVDLDLEFGNLSSFFGAMPKTSVADLCRHTGTISLAQVQENLTIESSFGLPILASPPTPDLASVVDGDVKKDSSRNYVQEILGLMKAGYDYVIIDTASRFSEAVITALDESSSVFLVTTPEVPALQATAKGLNVLVDRLGYDKTKLKLVLNRSNTAIGLGVEDMTRFLDHPISHRLPSDGETAIRAANTGIPMVRRRGRSPLSRAIRELAKTVAAPQKPQPTGKKRQIVATGR